MRCGEVYYQPTNDMSYVLDIRVTKVVSGVGAKRRIEADEKLFLVPIEPYYIYKGKQYEWETIRTTKEHLLEGIKTGVFIKKSE